MCTTFLNTTTRKCHRKPPACVRVHFVTAKQPVNQCFKQGAWDNARIKMQFTRNLWVWKFVGLFLLFIFDLVVCDCKVAIRSFLSSCFVFLSNSTSVDWLAWKLSWYSLPQRKLSLYFVFFFFLFFWRSACYLPPHLQKSLIRHSLLVCVLEELALIFVLHSAPRKGRLSVKMKVRTVKTQVKIKLNWHRGSADNMDLDEVRHANNLRAKKLCDCSLADFLCKVPW